VRYTKCCDNAARLSSTSAIDCSAITCNPDTIELAGTPPIMQRMPPKLDVAPTMLEPQEARDLRVRYYAVMQEHNVSRYDNLYIAVQEPQGLGAMIAFDNKVSGVLVPGDARTAQRGKHSYALDQWFRRS
jgi:hypothetical protein